MDDFFDADFAACYAEWANDMVWNDEYWKAKKDFKTQDKPILEITDYDYEIPY